MSVASLGLKCIHPSIRSTSRLPASTRIGGSRGLVLRSVCWILEYSRPRIRANPLPEVDPGLERDTHYTEEHASAKSFAARGIDA